MSRLALLVATAGYVGFVPVAPGTAGSVVGLALYALVRVAGSDLVEVAVMLVVLALGVWSATAAERMLGRKDPGPVVIDEVLGMLITLAFIPVSITGAVLGFLLFRALDIVKPFPGRGAERVPGGWGVMLDDLVAGLYGQAAMRLLAWVAPDWVLT